MGSLGGTNFKIKKALENAEDYCLPKEPPGPNDWLSEQFESG
jgi:hypothetical protein